MGARLQWRAMVTDSTDAVRMSSGASSCVLSPSDSYDQRDKVLPAPIWDRDLITGGGTLSGGCRPRRLRTRGTPEHLAVGCAYRATADGDASLGAAEELALALSASLRVMHVVEPMPRIYDAGETSLDLGAVNASIRAEAQRTVSERVAHLSSRLPSVATLYGGKPAEVLIALSDSVDILVIGCRGYGPLKAVLLGGVSGQVIRSAACPVVVVPRRARSAVGSPFASASRTEVP